MFSVYMDGSLKAILGHRVLLYATVHLGVGGQGEKWCFQMAAFLKSPIGRL